MAPKVLNETAPSSLAASVLGRIPYEEFVQLELENEFVEWVDGEIIPMSPVTGRHQKLLLFLAALFQQFADEDDLGEVLCDPFQMKTGPHLPGRAPDVIFVGREHRERIKPTYLEGPADLVVEIVSPGSGRIDRKQKFVEYETGGVLEYWIVDPQREAADFYTLDETGVFRPLPIHDGILSSAVLAGLKLPVEILWKERLPSPGKILSRQNQE